MKRGVAFVSLLQAGCVLTIHPPEAPADPVPVAVVDHGRHCSLVLPRPEGGSVEYAYGEWSWFALGEDGWLRVIPTILWPTPGTLGRRALSAVPGDADLRHAIPAEELLVFEVERARARALLRELDARFEANAGRRRYNPLYRLAFVPVDERYSCVHTCVHAQVRWLEALGCRVTGGSFDSSFRLAAWYSRRE